METATGIGLVGKSSRFQLNCLIVCTPTRKHKAAETDSSSSLDFPLFSSFKQEFYTGLPFFYYPPLSPCLFLLGLSLGELYNFLGG